MSDVRVGQSLPKRDVRVTSVCPQSPTLSCGAANDAKGRQWKWAAGKTQSVVTVVLIDIINWAITPYCAPDPVLDRA